MGKDPSAVSLPVDMLYRERGTGFELRQADDGGMPTLYGHFAVFNRWTEIDSWWEGNFMERIRPGAFKKTFNENRESIRCLFQHGRDFQIGDKVLGTIEELREDDTGGYYEVPLFDTTYNHDLLPGLEARQYGSSFRFQIIKEQWDDEPGISDHNPKGIPERDILEVRLFEFGPVTFPAYAEATAGTRSLTDHIIETALREANPEALRQLADRIEDSRRSEDEEPEETTPEDPGAAAPAEEPDEEPREHSQDHSEVTQAMRRKRLLDLKGESA